MQLTKLVYTIVYRRTLDAVIKRCTRGADRQWLGLLMLRTPMTSKADENQWPLSVETWLGSAASELKRAHEWAAPHHYAGLTVHYDPLTGKRTGSAATPTGAPCCRYRSRTRRT